MSIKPKYPGYEAELIVKELDDILKPYTTKFLPVGSVGRSELWVGDIDILVQPAQDGHGGYKIGQIEREIRKIGTWVKGGTRQMTVKNVLGSTFQLDLFLCHPPAQWGVLVGVRLNPAEFVIWAKARLDGMGYKREAGTIYDPFGHEISIKTEEDYFKLLGLDWVPADKRQELCRQLGLEPI